jgi:hypothetical protein
VIRNLVLVAASFLGLGVEGITLAVLSTRRASPNPAEDEPQPQPTPSRRGSALRGALATLHPFRLDHRVVLGIVLAALAAIARSWLLVVPSLVIGYVLGDLFLKPALAESVEELSSMLQFIIDFRSGLLAGGVSVPTALELALEAQPSGAFTAARRPPYHQIADPSAMEQDARRALAELLTTTNPFIHITDVLVFPSLRATNLRIATQLDLLGDVLLQQVQSYRSLVVTELLSSLGEMRLITLITVGAVYATPVALGSSLASDLGLALLAQLVAIGASGPSCSGPCRCAAISPSSFDTSREDPWTQPCSRSWSAQELAPAWSGSCSHSSGSAEQLLSTATALRSPTPMPPSASRWLDG